MKKGNSMIKFMDSIKCTITTLNNLTISINASWQRTWSLLNLCRYLKFSFDVSSLMRCLTLFTRQLWLLQKNLPNTVEKVKVLLTLRLYSLTFYSSYSWRRTKLRKNKSLLILKWDYLLWNISLSTYLEWVNKITH